MSNSDYHPKKIRVFRNGDIYSPGKKMVVSSRIFKNYEQLLAQIAKDVPIASGAVRRIYTLDGAPIRALEDLKDGGIYAASGGESFKRAPYLLDEDSVADAGTKDLKNRRLQSRVNKMRSSLGMLDSDVNTVFNKNEKQIFGPSTKAFKVVVFANNVADNPSKVILNYRNCRSYEQLLRCLSQTLKLASGTVRRVYDAITYKRIDSLQELVDGHNLIAVTHEPVKKIAYQIFDPLFKAPHSVELSPKIAHFFPNGDPYHMGISVSITKKRFTGLSKLLDHLNNQIELVTGKIQKVYAMDSEGQKIGGIDELEHGKGYILVANNDPLIRIRYNTKAIQTVHQGPPGLAGSTMKNEHMAHIRKVSQKWPKERSFNQQPSFNNQTSFSEKPAEEPRVSQAKRKESVKKTPATPKKAVTPKPATSEAIGTNPENFDSIDDAAAQEEVYGEQELQYLEAANAKTPRTPVAKEADPQSALVSPQNATKSGARSAAIATPAPNSKSQGNIRSAIMSPEAQARSAVMSPEAQARSAVMSAKSNARSALSSAQSSVPGSEAEEEVAPSTRASSAQQIAQKPDTPKSKRSSKENLKAGAKETLVSRAQTPKSRKQTPGGALDDNSTRDAEPAVTKSTKSSADNLKSMTKSTKSSRDALKTPKAPDA